MDLSNDLISQFAKLTTGEKDKNKETTVYGTVKIYDGKTCVKIDGSDLLTPVDTTTEVKEGERVAILIKNHSAVIMGNTSDPSASVSTTDGISENLSKITADIGEFKDLTTENLTATNANIEKLTAKDAEIEELVAKKATIEDLEAETARIDDLVAEVATIDEAMINKAEIKDLEAEKAKIEELQADTAKINEAIINKADISMMEATWADINDLEADIAEIDTALIGKASIDELNAVRAEITELNVTELKATVADLSVVVANKAEIADLNAANAEIERLDTETARIDEALVDKASISQLEAVEAQIKDLNVDQLHADIAEIDEALINKANVSDLNAANANIKNLQTDVAEIDEALINKANVSDLNAANANIKNLQTDIAEIDEALINKANVSDLNAANATIQDLTARVGVINDAMIGKASIEELQAVEAQIEDLDVDQLRADVARIDEAVVNKANIADLNAANADIEILNTQVADINTLVNGNLTSDNIASLHLTAANTTIDNAFIKDAMIDSVTANKITSGTIDTNKITIKSTDGSMILSGSVQQFKDENGKVRIQIGKDSGGNFTFVLYDSTGNGVLIDEDGIKSSNAIADGLIVDSKVAENANISGSKLDIASVITEVNNDNSTTIKSNKIYLDEQGQSLEVAFNSLKTQVDTIQDVTIDGDLTSVIEQVQTNTTQINANKTNISTLMSENTLRKEEIKDLDDEITEVNTTMSNKYTSLEQDLSGFKNTVGETYATKSSVTDVNNNLKNNYSTTSAMNSAINQKATEITNSVSQTYATKDSVTDISNDLTKNYSTTAQMNSAITQKANEITNTVSQTYATKSEFNNLEVGGKNLIANSAPSTISGWAFSNGWTGSLEDCVSAPYGKAIRATATTAGITAGMHKQPIDTDRNKFVDGAEYTISAWIRASKEIRINFHNELMPNHYITIGTTWEYHTFTNVIDTSSKWQSNTFYVSADSNIAVNDWFEVHSLKLEKGDKATDWTPAPEDVDDKIYDVEAQIKLTADAWTATFASSGGYNLIRNSTGNNSSKNQWVTNSSIPLGTSVNDSNTGSPSRYFMYMTNNETTEKRASSARFRLRENTTYRFTGYFHNYTACSSFDVYVLGSSTLAETDTSMLFNDVHVYKIIDSVNTQGMWKKISVTFTTKAGIKTGYLRIDHNGYNSSGTGDSNIHWSAISLTRGEAEVPWSPHPDEIYSGITTIDATGIKVNQTGYSGYTQMTANGFYVNDGTTDAVKITKDGAVFTGKMVVQSGSTIPTTTLTGKVTSSQLDSAVTTDISTAKSNASTALSTANTAKSTADTANTNANTAKTNASTALSTANTAKSTADTANTNANTAKTNASTALSTANTAKSTADTANTNANTAKTNASTALSTANTAKSTADSVKSTVDAGKTNWNNAYNRVNEWAYGAVTGSTTIDGGLIETNTIKAEHIAISDFNNYCVYPYNSTMTNDKGQTVPAYNVNSINHSAITQKTIYGLVGGEKFRVKCKIRCGDTADTVAFIFTWRKADNTGVSSSSVSFTTVANTITSHDGVITVPTRPDNAAYGNIKITSSNTASGVKVSDVIITRMASGELIVDGAITANKISSNAVTADKISSNAVTTDKLNANAVTAAKISSGAITADKISSGAITADKVAAGAITAKHVTIADSSNILIASPSENPYGSAIYEASDGQKYFKFGDNTTMSYYKCIVAKVGTNVSVKNTDKFRLIFRAYATLAVTIKFIWRIAYTDNTFRDIIQYQIPITTNSTIYEKELPANYQEPYYTKTIKSSEIFFELPNNVLGYAYVKDASLVRKSAGDLIVDGSITADKISTNAVTADKISSNAITADKISSNAITTDKISAGAITGNKIAANSVNADHITIGDFSNYFVRNYATTATNDKGQTVPAFSVSQNNQYKLSNKIYGLVGGEKFRVKCYIRCGETAGKALIVGVWRKEDGTSITSSSTGNITGTANTIVAYSGILTVGTRPDNAGHYDIKIQGVDATTVSIMGITITRMSNGELIVDGAITADKVSSNAVTADKISSNAVTTTKLAANAVTADKIAANTINATKMLIGDTTNLCATDPYSNIYDATVITLNDGSKYFRFGTANSKYDNLMLNRFYGGNRSIKQNDKYRLSFMAYASVACSVTFLIRAYYTDSTYTNLASTRIDITTSSTVYTKEITINSVVDSTKTINNLTIWFETYNHNNYVYVRDIVINKKANGELIVDGSITADKISSNAVTTAKLAANAVTADKISAGAVTTAKLAVKDGTNYSQLTDQTAASWGWTKEDNSDDPHNCWFTKNTVSRDNQISEYYPCKGGEKLRVSADIFTSVYGQTTQGGTATATALGVTIMIFTRGVNKHNSWLAGTRVKAENTSGKTGSISNVITLPDEARRFAVYVQIEGHPQFSGTLKVRNVIVNKMASGELIVDGAITADKLAANAVTASMITTGTLDASKVTVTNLNASNITTGTINASKINITNINASNITSGTISGDRISGGTLTATEEIKFLGGARIFGNTGENNAGLSISASGYSFSGGSQSFLYGDWEINNGDLSLTTGGITASSGQIKSKTLNVSSTSTLSGGVTCGSTLTAKGITSSTTLNVTGASTLTGAVSTGTNLTVAGTLNLTNGSIWLGTRNETVTAAQIKFGTGGYIAAYSGFHVVNSSGSPHTLYAGTMYTNGTTVTSDRRKKMDIRYVNVDKQSIGESGRMAPNTNITIQDMHEFIGSLPLTSFRYKDEVKDKRNLTHYGFLTQDIMYTKVGSELVAMLDENKRIGDEDDYTGYSVEKLLMFVCGALQEEIRQRQLLEQEIKNLKEDK